MLNEQRKRLTEKANILPHTKEKDMIVTNLEIENFRGIKKSAVSFSLDTRIICLIGAGDSTKSTLLKAIEWILWPTWNLMACDNDFYECDVSNKIVLRGTFSEVPERLLSEDKFGLYLRKPNVAFDPNVDDEPEDGKILCLTVQLSIDQTLEPKWEVVCNRKEPKNISPMERKLLSFGKVGENSTKDMAWGKSSVLQKYADAKGVLHDAHTVALREVVKKADLHMLDSVAESLTSIGKEYGVDFGAQITNRLIVQNGSFSSSVGLFEGNSPLTQRGTGSQRLLSMGLNIDSSKGDSLLLVDEIESGLEPYRLKSLLHELRIKHEDSGQVIMTTHSPVVVAECTVDELLVIRSMDGTTEAFSLKCADENANAVIQAQVRRNADAFLCKKLIICEGKTEIGFIRAFDSYLYKTQGLWMAYKGIGTADGGGDEIFKCADVLFKCGYGICLFMDSDLEKEDTQKEEMRKKGIEVFDWDKPNALEEQIFSDISLEMATQLINIAAEEHGMESVRAKLSGHNIPCEINDDYIILSPMDNATKRSIGSLAKRKKVEWFKRIDLGEAVGGVVFMNIASIDANAKLKSITNALSKWVTGHE